MFLVCQLLDNTGDPFWIPSDPTRDPEPEIENHWSKEKMICEIECILRLYLNQVLIIWPFSTYQDAPELRTDLASEH